MGAAVTDAPLIPLSGVELRGLIQARDICQSIGDDEAVVAIRSILKRGAMYVSDWAEAVAQIPQDGDLHG